MSPSLAPPHEWLFAGAARAPDAPALATPRARLTYGVLAARVRALASRLLALGLSPGERVLSALPSSPGAAVAALAVQAAGGCSAEVSPALGPAALASVATQVGARFAFLRGRDTRRWEGFPAATRLTEVWLTEPAAVGGQAPGLASARCHRFSEDGVDPEAQPAEAELPGPCELTAPALILFTSGSTGTPRGVLLSTRNLAANAASIADYLALGSRDRALLVLPLSYAYGRSVLHSHLLVGGSVFLDDRFMYPRVVLGALVEERCTGFAGVPATFELLRRNIAALPDGHSLRYATQAGGGMVAETTRWCRSAFAPAALFVMYGQTEATARLAFLPPEHGARKEGSIGVPIPGVELRVVDPSGNELPDGEAGELVARGENVALGYLEAPEEQARAFRDGWLFTGDLARRDPDGFFFLVGRAKELLKVAGHRVSPAAIEEVLLQQPGVQEAAVVGLPDPLQGEVVAAAVVPSPGTAPTPDDLRRRCAELLPPHEVPRQVLLVEALPRNEVGKLLRLEVAKLFPARTETGGST